MRKPVFGASEDVRHKLGCIATEDGLRLEISYLGSRGLVHDFLHYFLAAMSNHPMGRLKQV